MHVAAAAAAVSAIRDGLQPAFAMIDMGLPDARGDELVRELRTIRPDLPVIIVSGYSHSELQSQFAGDLCVAIVTKPYAEADLIRAAATLGVMEGAGRAG